MEQFLAVFKYFPQFDAGLSAGLMIFARFLAFSKFAPVLNRQEVNTMIRLGFSLMMTIIFLNVLSIDPMPKDFPFIIGILMNVVVGATLGFIANAIFTAVAAGGDMINMQMGLQSANILDPSTKTQNSLLSTAFNLLACIIYINIGGFYWLIKAAYKSFDLAGVYITSFNMQLFATPEYLVSISSNVLYFGMQIAAPIMLASLGQDIILGMISRTTEQKVNVFQLSFLFKPGLGAIILIFILPMLMNVISDYYESFAKIIN